MSQQENLTDAEKMKLATEGIESFVSKFGPDDIYRTVLLDIILERLYGEDIHLPQPEGQEGRQVSDDSTGSCPTYEIK